MGERFNPLEYGYASIYLHFTCLNTYLNNIKLEGLVPGRPPLIDKPIRGNPPEEEPKRPLYFLRGTKYINKRGRLKISFGNNETALTVLCAVITSCKESGSKPILLYFENKPSDKIISLGNHEYKSYSIILPNRLQEVKSKDLSDLKVSDVGLAEVDYLSKIKKLLLAQENNSDGYYNTDCADVIDAYEMMEDMEE